MARIKVVIDLDVQLLSIVVAGRSERVSRRPRSSQPANAGRVQTIGCAIGAEPIRVRHIPQGSSVDKTRRIKDRTERIPRHSRTRRIKGGAARTIAVGKRNHVPGWVESLCAKYTQTLKPGSVVGGPLALSLGGDRIAGNIDRVRDTGYRRRRVVASLSCRNSPDSTRQRNGKYRDAPHPSARFPRRPGVPCEFAGPTAQRKMSCS